MSELDAGRDPCSPTFHQWRRNYSHALHLTCIDGFVRDALDSYPPAHCKMVACLATKGAPARIATTNRPDLHSGPRRRLRLSPTSHRRLMSSLLKALSAKASTATAHVSSTRPRRHTALSDHAAKRPPRIYHGRMCSGRYPTWV